MWKRKIRDWIIRSHRKINKLIHLTHRPRIRKPRSKPSRKNTWNRNKKMSQRKTNYRNWKVSSRSSRMKTIPFRRHLPIIVKQIWALNSIWRSWLRRKICHKCSISVTWLTQNICRWHHNNILNSSQRVGQQQLEVLLHQL